MQILEQSIWVAVLNGKIANFGQACWMNFAPPSASAVKQAGDRCKGALPASLPCTMGISLRIVCVLPTMQVLSTCDQGLGPLCVGNVLTITGLGYLVLVKYGRSTAPAGLNAQKRAFICLVMQNLLCSLSLAKWQSSITRLSQELIQLTCVRTTMHLTDVLGVKLTPSLCSALQELECIQICFDPSELKPMRMENFGT